MAYRDWSSAALAAALGGAGCALAPSAAMAEIYGCRAALVRPAAFLRFIRSRLRPRAFRLRLVGGWTGLLHDRCAALVGLPPASRSRSRSGRQVRSRIPPLPAPRRRAALCRRAAL